ncbi:MAG: RRXRR domain-containing protein, partial [Blastocatellia bacterium]|nr:RRXRR domain-containing protein [Blastocatellia bacterium]
NSEERLRVSGSRSYIDTKSRKSHSVFVLSKKGKPLTPTTSAKARKLLRGRVAKPVWSKFNTFGIQMLVETNEETPHTILGVDNGTKFEGYSVVCGEENNLNIKLDLPDKKQIVKKLEKRKILRRAKRHRKCRRRPKRFDNRRRKDFLAPSQAVIVNSRLKVMKELFRIYPIRFVGFEDVGFNHSEKRWGANFSTVEIGKARLRAFTASHSAQVFEFKGHETQELRKKYGYPKTRVKSADKFTAHCSDSLALAVEVGPGEYIEPGKMIVVDDTYRPVRRQLTDTQPAKGGVRAPYSRGTVFGFRKGLLIGTTTGKIGRLCGEYLGGFRYYDSAGKRQSAKRLSFACGHFVTREETVSLPLREARQREISPVS